MAITLPGLIDCHVHFRVPGQEYKEDWITGSAAALAGGVTGVVDMPSNVPPVLTLADIERKHQIIKSQNPNIEYKLPVGVTDSSIQEALAAQDQTCGFKVFLQPHATGLFVQSDEALDQLYQGAQKIVMIHDDTGPERILQFVRKYKKPTYFCHVSTADHLEQIREAKNDRLPVYAEVTLHHLFLDQSNQQLGNRAKVNPTLATPTDRAALWQGIRDGVVDTIATDHAPHTVAEKDSTDGAAGFPSIEFFAPLLFTGVAEGKLTVDDIIRCCYTNPRKLFGFEHTRAVVIDPDKTWTIRPTDIKSKCGWSPYVGILVTGQVISVKV
ncbi:MAG TPA: hypothetical protein DEG44_02175 [Candidatus Kerfeldbacteria bacterium]|nr:hypothetical protein [Candidatus Kerfeldbacteria bacterium]